MPLPLTVTVSVSTGVGPPLWNSVKVMVPVGLKPPDSVAASVKIGGAVGQRDRGRVGAVMIVGLAALTVTCSLAALLSLTVLLLVSPL